MLKNKAEMPDNEGLLSEVYSHLWGTVKGVGIKENTKRMSISKILLWL